MKFKTIQYSFTLFVCLLSAYKGSAQKSIFEKDTVSFSFRTFDRDDKDNTNSGFIPPYPERDRWIFMDNKGIVHWNINDQHLWNSFLGGLKWDGIISAETRKRLEAQEPHYKLPEFRTYLKDSTIHYETSGKEKLVFFKASLKGDTIRNIFSLMNTQDGPSLFVKESYYTYSHDTTLAINGTPVPCYTFSMQSSHVYHQGRLMTMFYSEILFEKKSLLPLFIKSVRMGRSYYGNDDGRNADTVTWQNPYTYYFTRIIGVYKNGAVYGSY